jgi:septum formation protein
MYKVILASGSPRRKEIMDIMGIKYEVISSDVKEEVHETEPAAMVKALAILKSNAGADIINKEKQKDQEYIIIGADTMVFYEENALGKPKDVEDAVRMISMLSGNTHEVYTGVGIVILHYDGTREELSTAVSTKVSVQDMTMAQIREYVATGEPMDKAGAYAIQGQFGIYIKEIQGDYYNVVGFPIAKIYSMLLKKGIDLKKLK